MTSIDTIAESELKEATWILSRLIFEDVFDGMDDFSNVLTLKLSKNEQKSVKAFFYYDADCEGWLTHEPRKVVEHLCAISERFNNVLKFLVCEPMYEYYISDLKAYLTHYALVAHVKDTCFFGDGFTTGYDEFLKSHSNLAGYNMSIVGIEENGASILIEETHAIPPDDWGGIAILTDKELSDYYPLIAIANVKGSIERRAWEYDIRDESEG